jgi:beta-glucosidase
VVQVYVTREERANPSVPRVELVAFDVIELAPGASETVNFDIDRERFGYYGVDGELVMPDGKSMELSIGGGQPGHVPEGAAVSGELVFN